MNLLKKVIIFSVFVCTFTSCALFASSHQETTGYHLVHSFWESVMRQDVESYSHKLSHNFQGLNTDGIYNRHDQITGLSGLTVTSFQLENLKTSRSGKTLVISYDFYATGDGIVSGPSIDVWQKCDKTWKQISHSYVPF